MLPTAYAANVKIHSHRQPRLTRSAFGGPPVACIITPEKAERGDGPKELLRRNMTSSLLSQELVVPWSVSQPARHDALYQNSQYTSRRANLRRANQIRCGIAHGSSEVSPGASSISSSSCPASLSILTLESRDESRGGYISRAPVGRRNLSSSSLDVYARLRSQIRQWVGSSCMARLVRTSRQPEPSR